MNATEAAYLLGYDLQGVELEDSRARQDETRRYEEEVMDEARRIASGESDSLPTREHLRVALSWLDGRAPQPEPPAFDGEGDPF